MRRVILSFFLLALTSCAGNQHPQFTNLSPEGKVAVVGRQLVAAVREVVLSIDQMIVSGLLPREEGVAVLQRLSPVGTEAQRLADVLLLIDESKTEAARTEGLQQAAVIIRAIQQRVGTSVIPIRTASMQERVAGLLGRVSDVLITISLALPNGGALLEVS